MKRPLLFIVLIFTACSAFARGNDDSTVYKKYYGFNIKYVLASDFDRQISFDSLLDRLQIYDPGKKEFGLVTLGNLGYATYSQIFTPNSYHDFDLGFHQFDPYLFSADKIKYYLATHPLTQVQYILGAKGEQMLTVSHTQNIIHNWNAGFDFLRIGSTGFYHHQSTNITDLDIYTWYQGKKQHYNLFAAFVLNDLRIKENGGVLNDNVFTDTSIFIKSIAPVRLDSAENFQRSYEFSLQQSWDFGSYFEQKVNDTVTFKKLVPVLRLQDKVNYFYSTYSYFDLPLDNQFYSSLPVDTSITQDSLRLEHFSNTFRAAIMQGQKKFLPALFKHNSFIAALHNDWYDVKQKAFDSSFQTMGVEAVLATTPDTSGIHYWASGNYDLVNYKTSIYKIAAQLGYDFGKQQDVTLGAESYQTTPSFISTHFISNFNNWTKNLSLESVQTFFLNSSSKKWNAALNVSFYTIKNYIYWGLDAQPYQTTQPVNALVIDLKKDFKFIRNFHFNNEVLLQEILNGSAYINLPEFVSRHSLYYENKLFKHALEAQIGIDVNYNSEFYVPGYMPESGQFYLQFYSLYPTYPVMDAFINIRIKTLRAFAKVENADQNLFQPGYFSAYHYPMPDLSFKVGINWTFRN